MKNLFVLLLLMTIIGCLDGSGVISTNICEEQNLTCTPELIDNENGGELPLDELNPTVDIQDFYTSFDLSQMIQNISSGGTIVIDKNVKIESPVLVDKEVILKGLNNTIEIDVLSSIFIDLRSNNFTLEDLVINMKNANDLVVAERDPVNSNFLHQGINILNNFINVQNFSSSNIIGEDILFKNNSVVGDSSILINEDISSFSGDNINILGNIFIDKSENYSRVLSISSSTNVSIESNLVSGFIGVGFFGAITVDNSSNIVISNNRVQDKNVSKILTSSDPMNLFNGASGVGIIFSNNVMDSGISNFYSGTRFLIEDGNSLINLGPQTLESSQYNYNDIFNNSKKIICDSEAFFNLNLNSNLNIINSKNYAGSSLFETTCN